MRIKTTNLVWLRIVITQSFMSLSNPNYLTYLKRGVNSEGKMYFKRMLGLVSLPVNKNKAYSSFCRDPALSRFQRISIDPLKGLGIYRKHQGSKTA